VVLVAAVLVVALVALSNTANQAATTVTATTPAATTPTAAAPAPTTTTTPKPAVTVARWPTGVTGYTVVLGVIPSKGAATASATKIASSGIPAGILYSSDYSSMRPGDWIVFSGTYTTLAQADTAAAHIKTKGQPGAYAFSVVPAAHQPTHPAP
jgi:hypothetical protein